MSAANDLTRALLGVLRGVPGVRPATPLIRPEASWMPWDLDALAIDVDDDLVQIRVVALTLPSPPIPRRAEAALRLAPDESGRTSAQLRLVVTGIDAAPVNGRRPAGDRGHTIGS